MLNQNDKEERWIPIAGWESLYEVSNKGRVRRLDSVTSDGRSWKSRVLKPYLNKKREGYLRVRLQDGKRYKRCLVNRLVGEAFHGPCPEGEETRHLDGEAGNNYENNLVWGTKEQNEADKVLHGTLPLGTRNGQAVLTESNVRRIRLLADLGMGPQELGGKFGVHRTTIARVVSRKSWKHI